MSSSNAVPVESKIKYLEYSSSWNYSGSMLWTYPARAESSIRSTLKLETPPPKASDSHSHSGSEQSEPGQQPATQPSSSQSSHSESTPSATTNGLSTSSASHPVPPATQAGSSTSNDATRPVTIPRYVYTSKLMQNFKPPTLFWSDTETPKRPTINEPQFRAEDDSDRNVYTAEHHSIKLLLWHAEKYGRILWTDYTAIQIALAALSVFSKPELRAHWVFWDWRSQTETARTIDQVYRDASHRIQFPYPWDNNYASYALKDVNILQRAAHEVLLDKDWYLGVLAPTWLDIVLYTRRLQKQERDRETRKKKKAASKTRKRKGPQLGSRKRAKHATTAAPRHDDRTDADPADDTVPGSTPKAGKKRGREAVVLAESGTAPQTTTTSLEQRPKVPLRTSARIKKLQEESGTVTLPTATPGPSTSPSPEDPALRSTSGASSRTVVATPGSQSRSRSLSAQTVVGAIGKGKGKGKEIEADEGVDTVADEDSKLMPPPPPPAPGKVRTRASSVVPPPLVTRARARELQRAAATPEQSVAAPPPKPLEKSTRAKSKSKIASTPYPKGKEAQIASGRGKAKKAKN